MKVKRLIFFHKPEQGQALLFIVIAMVIVLTVSLSVATRSIVNLRTSTEEASSQQAFSAAEAGIEKYLKSGESFSGAVGNANTTVTSQTVSGADLLLNNGNPVLRDDGIDLWLSTYPNYTAPQWNGNITVFWAKSSDPCTDAAIEVVLIYNPVSPKMKRFAFDRCAARRGINNFTLASTSSVPPYTSSTMITVDNAEPGLLVRIIPLYYNTAIFVQGRTSGGGANPFPIQGTKIESVGALGDTKRKIAVYQGYPKIPNEFFSHVLFSP